MGWKERLPTIKRAALTAAALSGLVVMGKANYDRARPESQSPHLQISLFSFEISNQVLSDVLGILETVPKETEVAFLFYGGGEGDTPLIEKPDWQETLEQMEEFLEKRGYNVAFAECFRREASWEIILPDFTSEAVQEAALKVALLQSFRPEAKFVVVGESWGARFARKLKKSLERIGAGQVLFIEIGEPLGANRPLNSSRELRIAAEDDHVTQGNLVQLALESSPRVFWGDGDVNLGNLGVDFSFGPHDNGYSWSFLKEKVCDFLGKHFPSKQKPLSSFPLFSIDK